MNRIRPVFVALYLSYLVAVLIYVVSVFLKNLYPVLSLVPVSVYRTKK